ncbi:sialate O-acetylesterase [Caulobacter sp. DWR1-3-2b1]|uniref:sialate O-acetylesterase n=1 Tax=Caulobacter sp. DWR1-3-2b1 TaxID=2804670 RepID=UPI003CE7CF71
MKRLLLAAVFAGLATAASAQSLLAPVFSDHAVLQRSQPIRVWGLVQPNAGVEVELSGATISAVADTQGRWSVALPAREPGEVLTLTVRSGGERQTISDLLIGDVWLCSGQSNMEMPLRRIMNGDNETAGATDPDIRLLQTGRVSLPAPTSSLPKESVWRVASPQSAGDFASACFFMGRDIKKTTGVPVGLIDATWGGSIIQDWISREGLTALGNYDDGLGILSEYTRSPEAGVASWGAMLERWAAGVEPHARDWKRPDFDDRAWASLSAENFWEVAPELSTFDGTIWLRGAITLTARQAAQAATLSLGPVDDIDTTFVNGRQVGSQQGWNAPRDYALARGALKAGRNVIALRVIDTGGGGGAWGPAAQKGLKLANGAFVPLDGAWRYKVSTTLDQTGLPPHAPWLGASGLSTLHNGMIASLAPYGLRGFAWYQGEANVTQAAEYARLMPALIADWRREFASPDLPFLMVQLASFGPYRSAPAESGWAALRDVQRRTAAADPKVGMASAVDLGDIYDIHPTNKQQVGARLALLARKLAYGETTLSAAGPAPVSARREGAAVVVAFDQPLVVFGAARPAGFELCDAAAVCRFVDATADGAAVSIAFPAGPAPIKVRFAWAESPILNLYGSNRLPATPFELRID